MAEAVTFAYSNYFHKENNMLAFNQVNDVHHSFYGLLISMSYLYEQPWLIG
jgi:hypothetical protein